MRMCIVGYIAWLCIHIIFKGTNEFAFWILTPFFYGKYITRLSLLGDTSSLARKTLPPPAPGLSEGNALQQPHRRYGKIN